MSRNRVNRQAFIVGVGQTEYRKWGRFNERTELSLACEAIRNAANDAGLALAEVDGFASFANDPNEGQILQQALGTGPLRFSGAQWGGGGAGACGAVALAAMAVESGRAECVVVVRALAQGQRGRFGQFRPGRPHSNFMTPFGLFSPPQYFSLLAMRFMHDFHVTEEHLAQLVMNAHEHASRNPDALAYSKPLLDRETYFDSRMISEPFRIYDCALETDGACAVIVTSNERAKDLRSTAVAILASGQGSEPGWGMGPIGVHTQPMDKYTTGNHAALARRLFDQAGVGVEDVRVAQIYDNFSLLPLYALEDYGFCGRGEAAAFLEAGGIAGERPRVKLNTSGGHLAEGYVHGLTHVLEGARQVRGTSHNQAVDADVCLVVSSLALSPASALILGKNQ